MRRLAGLALAVLVALSARAGAEAPGSSPRPEPRASQSAAAPAAAPVRAATRTVAEQIPGLRSVPRPAPRPETRATRATAPTAAPARATARAPASDDGPSPAPQPTIVSGGVVTASAAPRSQRPAERPGGLRNLFRRAAQPAAPAEGSVCGVRAIRGKVVAPVPGAIRGCGIPEPVRITEVAGIRLSTSATIDCPTARALNTWVEQGAKPAIGKTGGGLVALQVAAHYACRTRNNRPGARISEHGRGKAVDISAFVLKSGERITVLHGWRSRNAGPMMRQMHKAACGPFGTVLGPNSDRFHQDHFHFDTASYRSGPYCR